MKEVGEGDSQDKVLKASVFPLPLPIVIPVSLFLFRSPDPQESFTHLYRPWQLSSPCHGLLAFVVQAWSRRQCLHLLNRKGEEETGQTRTLEGPEEPPLKGQEQKPETTPEIKWEKD